MLPTSLYIHIPWCIRKCPYCDFNSHQSDGDLPEFEYVTALLADLDSDLELFHPRPLHSIFIGGGTPSLFSPKAYEKLFNGLQKRLSFVSDIEITLEANPGTVEQQRFQDYYSLGINRLSLGVQSFNSQHLKILGRIHDAQQAHNAIDSARKAGFENINLDLMYALPEQTLEQSQMDLLTAIDKEPEHISWYQLTLEPNTVFYKKPPVLPQEDSIFAIENAGLNLLHKYKYNRYEISAFCKANPSQHNLNYWRYGDYFGIGAGAHGKLTLTHKVFRTQKFRQPKDYLNSHKTFSIAKKQIEEQDIIFEFMLNASRLEEKITFALFSSRTGLSSEVLLSNLRIAQDKRLVTLQNDGWQITPFGRRYTNDLQALFLPA